MFTIAPTSAARVSMRIAVVACTAFGASGLLVPAVGQSMPAPVSPPTGGNAEWQVLAEDCYSGSMRSCDSLADQTKFSNAPEAAAYNDYGFSCGGRVYYDPDGVYVSCYDQFGS
jgi:hypothetical protein